ncbi:hypothetical protein EMA8858_00050 [Emticicia aquatica]|uniref:Uncharacterized protein n=1 Tax=Emticicia aquatica TaxID=1681835 RepID=A0ABM9AL17_9BACT|nr:hypothetical protein EMA8858_00050 [Emticicia aquatica]
MLLTSITLQPFSISLNHLFNSHLIKTIKTNEHYFQNDNLAAII